ncbi:rhodanese-related sulfurtransferase [Sphingomonas sp. R647]|uniref:oxygen-dependent tRNA uridine(34) hydroxylase TrhO n=1 Tax=Sphingomonas sp. R647 TaxID=2875233 RepID=UPI001CD3C29B|nr:rhodanese-related sulfurtransferase [Sphingomonas sp. R647]MCA1197178.1 rhodanese-related sulfurtransferase [Sphingomonas sp. R647]
MDGPVRVAALYQFTRFDDPAALRGPLLDLCVAQGVKGTLLLAREGVNGTIAGSDAAIDAVLAHVRALPGCAAIDVKFSHAEAMPFHRMKVRLKREIVTMGQPDIDPLAGVGHYVAPTEWNDLIADPDTVLIDTRNDYEVAIGTFRGAIDPQTRSFSEFPDWFRAKRAEIEAEGRTPKIAMFCTGGIRCEKSTAFAKAEGVEQVYHLKGGILAYLEAVPQDRSLWDGECFVFDERVAVKHGLEVGEHVLCRACRMPVNPEGQASADYVEGVSCPACVGTRTEEQRASYAERHRQSLLAQARGEAHVGAVFREHEPD